jgi:simple sugar transport system substrate-binding protein
VQNAIDSKVSGLAVTLANADAVIPVAQKAADAGIPVVASTRDRRLHQVGSKMYFGSDETLAGQDDRPEDHPGGGGKASV